MRIEDLSASAANVIALYNGTKTGSEFTATSASPQGKNFNNTSRNSVLNGIAAVVGTAPSGGNQNICVFAGPVTTGSTSAGVNWGTGLINAGASGGTNSQSCGFDIMVLNPTTIVLLMADIHGSGKYAVFTYTFSGTNTITLDQSYTGLPSVNATYPWPKMYRISNSRFGVVYNDPTTGYYTAIGINWNGAGVALTKDGSSSILESVVPNNGSINNFALQSIGSSAAIAAWKSSATSAQPKRCIITDSGTALTAGTSAAFGTSQGTASNCMPNVAATSKAAIFKFNTVNSNTATKMCYQGAILSSGTLSSISSKQFIQAPINLWDYSGGAFNSDSGYPIAAIGDMNGDGIHWFMDVIGSAGGGVMPSGEMWAVMIGVNTNTSANADSLLFELVKLKTGLTLDFDSMRNGINAVGLCAIDSSNVLITWGYSDGGATNIYWNSLVVGF